MYSFALLKQFCAGATLGNKLPNLRSTFKISPVYNNSPVNNISRHCFSTELEVQRLSNISTKCKPLLRTKYLHQKISVRWHQNNAILEMNTNVKNDVLLYKHISKPLSTLGIFMNVYITCWVATMMYIFYKNLVEWKRLSFSEKVKEFFNVRVIDAFMYSSGPLLYMAAWMFTGRIIKFIILRKGGNDIIVVTYNTLPKNRSLTCPISKVHCQLAPTTLIPAALKISGYYGHYMFDSKGTFLNRDLFEHTVLPLKK